MSFESHLAELERKHKALDELIEEEQRHPGASDYEITRLKKQKLKIKEELLRSRRSAA